MGQRDSERLSILFSFLPCKGKVFCRASHGSVTALNGVCLVGQVVSKRGAGVSGGVAGVAGVAGAGDDNDGSDDDGDGDAGGALVSALRLSGSDL